MFCRPGDMAHCIRPQLLKMFLFYCIESGDAFGIAQTHSMLCLASVIRPEIGSYCGSLKSEKNPVELQTLNTLMKRTRKEDDIYVHYKRTS